MQTWLEKVGLPQADGKTEVALIMNGREKNTVEVEVGGLTIIKYLEMMIDAKLRFGKYLEYG